MKKKTIYWIIGIAALAGAGIYGYKKGWFGDTSNDEGENESNVQAGIGRRRRQQQKCLDDCLRRYPNYLKEGHADHALYVQCVDNCNGFIKK